MRLIRYLGVMLIAGLAWAVISALLTTMGFGPTATKVVGFLLVFLLGPVLFVLAAGTKSNPVDAALLGERPAATNPPGVTQEQASQPPTTIGQETKVQAIVTRVVNHLRTWGVTPTTECWNNGNTCNINVVIDGAHYKIQIMDPTGFQTIAWRLVNGEEITLGTAENSSPTDIDRKIEQICRQVDQGRFTA